MTTALILGISGQDGANLSRHLLSLNYRVTGIVRRHSVAENQSYRIQGLDIETEYGDVTDIWSLCAAMKQFQPDEVYNLAAQSHVRVSFELKDVTMQTNGVGAWNVLEAARMCCPEAKVYTAASSEMFGNQVDDDGYQRLTTPMVPVSPYGCAKLFAFNGARHYRRAYGMFSLAGVLFNHSGRYRGSNFVEMKIAKTAVQIKRGLATELRLGNLDSQRDVGNSRDYVRAMHLMLQQPEAREWLVATGETHSVREMCEYIFGALGMEYRDYIVQDEKYMRPEELHLLRGDASETREKLDWEPEVSFEDTMNELIQHWENKLC